MQRWKKGGTKNLYKVPLLNFFFIDLQCFAFQALSSDIKKDKYSKEQ